MAIVFIAEVNASSGTQFLNFTAIPQTYTSLRIMGVSNVNYSLSQGLNGQMSLEFNPASPGSFGSDSKHAWSRLASNNSGWEDPPSLGTLNQNYGAVGSHPGTAPDSGYYATSHIIDIYNYRSSDPGDVQYYGTSTCSTYSSNYDHGGYWCGTYGNASTGITGLQIQCAYGNFMEYSKFSLYGRD